MLDSRETLANVVLAHAECATVFSKHKLDYCCRGNVSVDDACAARGLDRNALLDELESAIEQNARRGRDAVEWRALPTPKLIEHIVSSHHAYLRTTLPYVVRLADKVARVHGARDASLNDLAHAVRSLDAVLLPHLDEEEEVIFPVMLSSHPDRATLACALESMADDHVRVAVILEEIRRVTGDFVPPSWACTSYRALLGELENVEADLHEHVHLENHVLAPRFLPR